MEKITSINLSTLPFLGSCDSTRAQMAAKQMSQALTHKNCDIPYVLSNDYYDITDNSKAGILKAQYDGVVIYRNDEFIVLYYNDIDKIEHFPLSLIKKTSGIFASSLNYSLNTGDKFKKGEIIYEYDNFKNGTPTFGYNVFTSYYNCFGYNHEDGLIVSESFVNQVRHQYTERVFIPIHEYTMLQPLYMNDVDSLVYFPGIGQRIKGNTVCTKIQPRINNAYSTQDMKHEMRSLLKSMNLSDLLSMQQSQSSSSFIVEHVQSKLEDAKVVGIKIHQIQSDIGLVDVKLQKTLDKLHKIFFRDSVIPAYHELSQNMAHDFSLFLLKKYCVYDKSGMTTKKSFNQCVYLIELELYDDKASILGDKFCNRYAGKGVVSLIVPDELRPIAVESQMPIDFIFNTFGVFSRMNISQILEGIVSKNVFTVDQWLKKGIDKDSALNMLHWLSEGVIKNLGDEPYYNQVNNYVESMKLDDAVYENFIRNVKDNNFYITAPPFSEVNIRNLVKNSVSVNEDVYMKKEFLEFIQDTMKVKLNFPLKNVVIKNIFCSPIYIMKLHKVVDHLISARDLGPCKHITKQPLKGRASGGGSRIGQMEVEGLLAHGTTHALKEILTVKSDYSEGKKDLIDQLVETGEYHFPVDADIVGGSKRVVSTLIKYLRS